MVPPCVKGKGKDTPSLVLKGSFAEVCLDYYFLTENELGRDETTEGDDVGDNPDRVEDESQMVVVMQESECRSVWSYAVDRKGASEERAIHQICEDLETVGLKDDRIIMKDGRSGTGHHRRCQADSPESRRTIRHRDGQFASGRL